MKVIVAALVAAVATACTPAQVHWFTRDATPAQQRSVVAHLQRPTDCYSALRHFPGDRARARRIVWRESRNNPAARNPRSSARGCFQLLHSLHAWRYTAVGCRPSDWSDARCNTLAAAHLFRAAGWQPWSL